MTAFFAWYREHKKFIFSRSKIRDKNPGDTFLDFKFFFNIAMESVGKNIIWSSWSSQKRFFQAHNIPVLGPNFINSVN